MTIEELTDRLPLITAAAFGVGALLVLVAMRLFRRSRRAPYWTQRRQAGQRGFRILLFSMFFFTASALLCALTLANNYIEVDEPTSVAQDATHTPTEITPTVTDTVEPSSTFTEEPTVTATATIEPTLEVTDTDVQSPEVETVVPQPSQTLTAAPPTDTAPPPTPTDVPPTETAVPPTATASATPTLTNTATLEPTATPTATPSVTPQPTSAVIIATVVGSQVPQSDASLSIINLSNRVSNDLRPTNEGTEFDSGFRRLYFMLEYDNMDSGVRWRRELYHNGVLVAGREDLWGNAENGQSLFFVSVPGGFVAGDYEIRVLLDTEEVDEASFTVN